VNVQVNVIIIVLQFLYFVSLHSNTIPLFPDKAIRFLQ